MVTDVSDRNDPSKFSATEPWLLDDISDEAIAWAEGEATRRGLTLAEWIEEAIEGALVAGKSGHGPDQGAA